MEPPKALFFDVFGTCVDWRTSVSREIESLAARAGVGVDSTATADAWRAEYQPQMETVRSGLRPWVNLDVLHREALDGVLTGTALSGIGDDERDELTRAWHRLDPWPDVVAGLTRLKTRHTICTLSNGNIGLLSNMAKRAALPWDCVLSAEVFRAYKPDPATYLGVARVFDLPPAAVMLVAAHQDDLAAARACGLQTAYVERAQEFGPSRTKDVSPDPANTLHARDFLDLATQLGC